ncbi:MAG: type III pantothenate kinase [Roseiflexaceae bacterium]|nr:type III pantothenate kinase [Roseiflexaceae bacterium]
MLLTIDIGNTNIKFGVYTGEVLVAHWRIATERQRLADEYAVIIRNLFLLDGIGIEQIAGCAISCVVPPLTGQFRDLVRNLLGVEPLFASSRVETGLRYSIDTPNELGADRVCNSLAAYRRHGSPVIAVAFGTATALDIVVGEGEYIGGAIAPGIGISADALFRLAAKLYSVELVRPPSAIGKNTAHYMQSGLILGYAGLVEGLVRRIGDELGYRPKVIATGGLADVIAAETDAINVVEPMLTLEGLRLMYELHTMKAE